MGKTVVRHTYEEIIILENLLEAWLEFVKGKRSRHDVQEFERHLMTNLIDLHTRLKLMSYKHSPYEAFVVSDPKTRSIHKACVADRVLHRAIYRKLYPFFDRTFISDSFSCRVSKGAHKALERFTSFSRKASGNHKKTVWVLKCDIRKFFASIDHAVLLRIIDERTGDWRIAWLLETIVRSFSSAKEGVGLPLGNLTSQLLANVYMNEFDQYVKHKVHVKYYVRYADDFVFLSHDRGYLESILPLVGRFLSEELHVELHPNKIELRTVASGVDFLGWVHFPDHRVLRTTTKRRMLRVVSEGKEAVIASYDGMLKHGNAFGLRRLIER